MEPRQHTHLSAMTERKRADPDTPERFLWRKPGARFLWFRMAVPVRYQPHVGKKIIQQCLGTLDAGKRP